MGKRGRGAASGADDGNHVDEAAADFVAASSSDHEVLSPNRMALALLTAAVMTQDYVASRGADDGNPAEQPPQAHALSDEQILAQLDFLERKLLFLQGAIRYLRGQVALRYPRPPPGRPRPSSTPAAAIVISDSPATLAGGPASPDVQDDLSPTSPRSQSCLNSLASTVPYDA